MRGSRVLVAFVVAGLALALVAIGVGGAAAQETAIGQDTAPLAPTATIAVTSTADSGPGTLRQAMIDAGDGDTIGFNTSVFPPNSPQTITLSSALPEIITNNLTIDASNAGVILDGSSTPTDTVGLAVSGADNVAIKGLQVLNFPVHGITLSNGATNCTIGGINGSPGGACSGDCNLISGSSSIGVLLKGSGTMSNTVSGNYIGTDVSGTGELGNNEGVRIDDGASGNVIGGDTPGERNIISGNKTQGVAIDGSGTVSNTVSGNYIGTDVSGTAIISSTASKGFFIASGASHNLIGGSNGSPGGACTGECNLISGYSESGIGIHWTGAMSNTVSGNYIGTNVTGTAALGNGTGVIIGHGATYNLIGGDSPTERNLISGNNGSGVAMYFSGTMSNTVRGNYIGTDPNGATAVANDSDGVDLNQASHNWVIDNLLSGNEGSGVSLCCGSDTSHNTISGNIIGLDASGTSAIPNDSCGVTLGDGPSNNLIGGDTPAERNIISGNGSNGVNIQGSGTMSNTVSGNYIGTNISGTVALGNYWDGVAIGQEASHNTIGGTTAGARNLISGNRRVGVSINGQGNSASYNVVQGNYIGTDVSGTAALGNGWGDPYTGVEIYYAADNTIAENLISGNYGNGIYIQGDTASGNVVQGNLIGTDVSGTLALGNGTTPDDGRWGIKLDNGAHHNTIGGTSAGDRNIISGNGDLYCGPPQLARADGGGVAIWGAAHDNTVQNNYIGMDVTGMTPIPNALAGIEIEGAWSNLIGGTDPNAGNLISGNSCSGPPPPRAGIRLAGDGNTVRGNTIGPDATGTDVTSMNDNGWTGIWIVAADNLIEDNLIVGNAAPDGTGISVWSTSAVSNTLTRNEIYGHGGEGISLEDGANNYMFPPLLSEVTASGVKGIAVPDATVEVFSDDDDEGHWYHGYTVVDGSGAFTFTAATAFTGTNVTATATDSDGNTSEFSSPYHPSRDVVAAAVYVPQQRHKVNEPITPTVRVGNGGTTAETFTITAVITRSSNGAQVYSHTQTVGDLGVFHYRTLALHSWTPVNSGGYTFELALEAATPDDNTTNDRLKLSFVVSDDRMDVWARDNLSDNGQEPSSGPVWQSPDVWVRNTPDGGTTHQDPINATTNTVYVTMRNRGTLTATNVAATVYWHPPSLVIGQSWWQPIGAVTVTQIAPGAAQVVSMSWPLNISGMTGSYHTCLLGVITTTQDMAPTTWDIASSNNLIQRNVDVIPQQANGSGLAFATSADVDSTFSIGNPYAAEQLADVIVDATNVPVTAELWIDLGDLCVRWEQIGQGTLVGAAHISGTTVITIAGGTDAEITGIPLTGEELAGIRVDIYGMDAELSTQVDVSERIGEDVLGGMTLDVTAVEYKIYLPLVLRAY
jgi:parallel beta-helix repeat protein